MKHSLKGSRLQKKLNISLLIKGLPTELEDSETEKLLANVFEGIKASRFILKRRN